MSIPPIAKKIRTEHTAHGETRIDEYHWLQNKEDPDTIRYLEEWNLFTEKWLESCKPLTDQLCQEFISRIEQTYKSVPYKVGEYDYYYRMEAGKEYSIYCRSKDCEEIILDANELAQEHDYVAIEALEPSPDGRYVAISIDTKGTQYGQIYIKDMASGIFIEEEVLSFTGGDIEWTNDSTGFWYTAIDEEMRVDKVCFHRMGSPPENDLLVFFEKDGKYDLSFQKDRLHRFIIIVSSSKDTSQVFLGQLNDPKAPLSIIQPRIEGIDCSFRAGEKIGYFLVSENRGNAYLQACSLDNFSSRETITFEDHVEFFSVFKDFLAILKIREGLFKIEVRSFIDGSVHEVALPHEIAEIIFEYNLTYETPYLRFTYENFIQPATTYRYHMQERTLEVLRQVKAGDFDPSQFTMERIWAAADDGVQVPITLCFKKGLPLDSIVPLYLYAYGSYGVATEPEFSIIKASLLERGVCCAIAHVRGGGDLGRQWYAEGCMMKKMNTFTDFINCAEHLIKNGYTHPDRLVIHGVSAGGLLMGVAINRRPDLFRACLAEVPFVDVITSMLDETLPLTTQERIEWGNPHQPEEYVYMMQYSPFDNIRAQNYPALYVTAGINDAQVPYYEPAKWVAKLLTLKTDQNPLLFEVAMGAGHQGMSGRFVFYEQAAPRMAFLLKYLLN